MLQLRDEWYGRVDASSGRVFCPMGNCRNFDSNTGSLRRGHAVQVSLGTGQHSHAIMISMGQLIESQARATSPPMSPNRPTLYAAAWLSFTRSGGLSTTSKT